jgi:tetratricopeptide (TPR) repeat protein
MILNPQTNRLLILSAAVVCFLVPRTIHAKENTAIPYPSNVALYKADGFIKNKEYRKAIEVLKSFQAKRPKGRKPGDPDPEGYEHYLIYFTLGNCYVMLEKIPEAIPNYKLSLERKSDFSSGWLNLAKCWYDLKKFAEAGKCFLKGYETSEKKDPEILYYSAVSFTLSADHEQALSVWEYLLEAHGSEIKLEWKEALIRGCLAGKQPRRALPHIETLAEKTDGKKQKQWQEILLHQYLSLGMNRKALDYANLLTRKYPLESKWWKALAHLHLSENRYENALIALTVYGFLDPLAEKEKKLLGDLNTALGIPIQAARFYEELVTGRSEKIDPEIIKKLAYCYTRLCQPEKAFECVEKGLNRVSDTELLMLKGQLLYEMQRYREAITVFEASTGMKKDPGRAWIMMGYAAWNVGEIQKARQAFENASQYPHHRKSAQQFLRRLKEMPHR